MMLLPPSLLLEQFAIVEWDSEGSVEDPRDLYLFVS